MIIIAIIFLVVIRYGLRYSRTISESVSESIKTIANPRRLFVDLIWGLIKGIIVGIFWKYLYCTIPLAVIAYFAFKYKRNYDMKATCKKIVEDIKNDLRNRPLDENGKKSISENEIIFHFSDTDCALRE